jgi:hypothetical protein
MISIRTSVMQRPLLQMFLNCCFFVRQIISGCMNISFRYSRKISTFMQMQYPFFISSLKSGWINLLMKTVSGFKCHDSNGSIHLTLLTHIGAKNPLFTCDCFSSKPHTSTGMCRSLSFIRLMLFERVQHRKQLPCKV